MVYFFSVTNCIIQDGDHAKIPHTGDVMSDQNPYPGDIRDRQIPMGWSTPPPLGLDTDRCISPALDITRAQLQRLQESRNIRTLKTAVRATQTHSHELWSKILNLDPNGVSETDITLAILKNKQTNKPLKITYESH